MKNKYSECTGMEVEIGSEYDQLAACLGQGAEGAVYELERFNDIVVKIFKKDRRDSKQEKIRRMVQDSLISPEDQTDIPWTAWPIDPVSQFSSRTFLGYAMPYLDTEQYIDAQRYASQNLRWEKTSPRQRYKPAINLTLTVYWLHQNGYAIGDLSEQNIRVNDGNVTLIDCDSYSIKGSDFAGKMEAPRYTPPEGRGRSHEEVKQTDLFGVTVHIFQFLVAGFHPYQAVGEDAVSGSLPDAIQRGDFPYGGSGVKDVAPPPAVPEYAKLPTSIRRGFEQCFSTGQHDPSARPSLEKWLAVLSEEGDFEIDGIDASDVTFKSKGQKRGDRNWQAEIRQSTDSEQRTATANRTATRTKTTASPAGESHWADDLRGEQTTNLNEQTTNSSAQIGSQSQNKSTGNSQDDSKRLTRRGILGAIGLSVVGIGFGLWSLVPNSDDSDDAGETASADDGGSASGDTSPTEDDQMAAANISITDITINDPIDAGERLLIAVTVTNTGDEFAEETLQIKAGSFSNAQRRVRLEGGGSTTETMNINTSANDDGSYPVVVDIDSDSATREVTIRPVESYFEVTEIQPTNRPVEGEDLEVVVFVNNTGEATDTKEITMEVDGLGSTSTSTTIEEGESISLLLTIPTSTGDSGVHDVKVSTEDESASGTVVVDES